MPRIRRLSAALALVASLAAPAAAQTTLFEWSGGGPETGLGRGGCGVGDLNGDGVPDVALAEHPPLTTPGAGGVVVARSGFDGATLWTASTATPLAGPFAAGDVNGDGVVDVAISDGALRMLSGLDGAVLWTRSYSSALTVRAVDAGPDLNGDGVGDVLAQTVHFWFASSFAEIVSGADGALLANPAASTQTGPVPMRLLPDVSGDGLGEWVLGARPYLPNQVDVYSSSALIHVKTLSGPPPAPSANGGLTTWSLGGSLGSPGDVDGDGLVDLAVGLRATYQITNPWGSLPPPSAFETRVYSTAGTWAPLYAASSFAVPGASGDVAGLGDLDLDGVPDFAVFGGEPAAPHLSGVSLLSGATGAPLSTLPLAGVEIPRLSDAGDVNFDGVNEHLRLEPYVDAPFNNAGRVRVASYAAVPAAVSTLLGGGCGATGGGVLTFPPPKLGATLTIAWAGASPSALGNAAFDFAPPSASALGAGCFFHLDLAHAATWWLVPIATDAAGAASLSIPVPSIPLLAGLPVTAQLVLLGTAGPFSFDLSPGVATTLGY
ncbi:MAG TPA: hypothetical protein VEI02_11280 [Planctomycetota bacterium]|nr:hypothetical protein [Planctomycetota bacterium]